MPQGGVARRATKINEIRKTAKNTVLLLDGGSTLFGQPLATQSEGRVVVEAMNALGYDAMAVGRADLTRGVETLLTRAREARFRILSCNLVSSKDQKPLLEPYTIIERDKLRFGILGVTEPDAGSAPGEREIAQVLDPTATVQRYLAEIRAKSDVLIVLSHLGLDLDKALAQQVPGIDIIVGGRSRKLLAQPEKSGDTVITQVGYDGEWLGRLDVSLSQGKVTESRGEVVGLGPDVPDDPALAKLVESWKQRFPEPTPPKP